MESVHFSTISPCIKSVNISPLFQPAKYANEEKYRRSDVKARHSSGRWTGKAFKWHTPKVQVQPIQKLKQRTLKVCREVNVTSGMALLQSGMVQSSCVRGNRTRAKHSTQGIHSDLEHLQKAAAHTLAVKAGFGDLPNKTRTISHGGESVSQAHTKKDVPQTPAEGTSSQFSLSPHTMWMLRRWKAKALGLEVSSGAIPLAPLRYTQQQVVKAQLKSHESTYQGRIAAAMANRRKSGAPADMLNAHGHMHKRLEIGEQSDQQNRRRRSVTNLGALAVMHAMMPLSARSAASGRSAADELYATVHSPQPRSMGSSYTDMQEANTEIPPTFKSENAQRVSESLWQHLPKRRREGGANTSVPIQGKDRRTGLPASKAAQTPNALSAGTETHHAKYAEGLLDGCSQETDTLESPAASDSKTAGTTLTRSATEYHAEATEQHTVTLSENVSRSKGIKQLQARIQMPAAEPAQLMRQPEGLQVDIPDTSALGLSSNQSTQNNGPVSNKAARVLGLAINALQRTSLLNAAGHSSDGSSTLSGFSDSDSE